MDLLKSGSSFIFRECNSIRSASVMNPMMGKRRKSIGKFRLIAIKVAVDYFTFVISFPPSPSSLSWFFAIDGGSSSATSASTPSEPREIVRTRAEKIGCDSTTPSSPRSAPSAICYPPWNRFLRHWIFIRSVGRYEQSCRWKNAPIPHPYPVEK